MHQCCLMCLTIFGPSMAPKCVGELARSSPSSSSSFCQQVRQMHESRTPPAAADPLSKAPRHLLSRMRAPYTRDPPSSLPGLS
jgi:hypothetical protein